MDTSRLQETIARMLSAGKGILAADESTGTAAKRLASIGLENTQENRFSYRRMLLETDGLERYVSAVILVDETTRQRAQEGNGTIFPEYLEAKGIVPGVKVDGGLKDEDPKFPNEPLASGLGDLAERLEKYNEESKKRLRFTKWRQTISIGPNLPTQQRIKEGMERMARYAKISQEHGFVPIVEPEVLMEQKGEGLSHHSGEHCREVTKLTLTILFDELQKIGADIRCTVLKTNLVIPGAKHASSPWPPERVGKETYGLLTSILPNNLPGVAFLSGGMKPKESTANLNAVAVEAGHMGDRRVYTCSFGRALQDRARKTWAGKPENVAAARKALLEDAEQNSLAQAGKYDPQRDPRESDR
jgi:fructose-bisphosphate aldolase class I